MIKVIRTVEDLIDVAEAQKLWIYCTYQDLWWTPAELRRDRAEGRFHWELTNFQQRDPQEVLASCMKDVADAQARLERVRQRMGLING